MERTNPGYDPFSYQPLMRLYYSGSQMLPDEVERAAMANPDKAQHIQSVWELGQWMKANTPDFHSVVSTRRPDLLDPSKAVLNNKLGRIDWGAPGGMGGLGQTETADQPVLTQWGTQLLDLAKGYMVYDAQKDLMRTNISRAERGLPPIDPGVIAPQVQVGVAPGLQTLMYIALAGVVIVGLTAALGDGRKRR